MREQSSGLDWWKTAAYSPRGEHAPSSCAVVSAASFLLAWLDTALHSQTLPGEWIYPHLELNNAEVLTMINNLGIYQEEVPPEALHIFHKPQAEE